jgi:hypothetical protein
VKNGGRVCGCWLRKKVKNTFLKLTLMKIFLNGFFRKIIPTKGTLGKVPFFSLTCNPKNAKIIETKKKKRNG